MRGNTERRRAERQIMDRALCGLSSEDDAEVLATLRSIMRTCEGLEASITPLLDHDRVLLDVIERLVLAMRARIAPDGHRVH